MAARRVLGGSLNSAPPAPSPSPPPLREAVAEEAAPGADMSALAPADNEVQEAARNDLPRAQRVGSKRVGQRHPMQTLCDAHRAPACRGHKGCDTAAPGTTRDTIDWRQRWGVRGSAHRLGREEYVAPTPLVVGGGDEEMASQRPDADLASTRRTGDPRRGHRRAQGEDTSPLSFYHTRSPWRRGLRLTP